MKQSIARIIQVVILSISAVGILIILNDRITIQPSQDTLKFAPYSDSEDFKSECSKVNSFERTAKRVQFVYTIGSTREFPYIGFGISRDSLEWNIARFDRVKIKLERDLTDNFTIILATFVEGHTNHSKGISYRLFERNIDAISSASLAIPLKNLETPTWWFAENGMSGNANRESLKKVTQIRFQSHPLSSRDKPQRMVIKAISFDHSPLRALPFFILGMIGLFFPHFLKRTRQFSFVPLEISNRENEEIALLEEYLGREYSRLDMSLQKVVLETGISETSIRNLLKKFHQKGFKEFLNGIRMIEGARLLRESDRQIAEIALYTGFRHATTFTKLFRTQFSCSPSEFREKAKKGR